jgi:hypothetical protein
VIQRKALTILGDARFRHRLERMRDVTHRTEDELLTRALEAIGAEPTDACVPSVIEATGKPVGAR